MDFRHFAALLALAVLAVAAPAAADDSGRNQEGFWTVGRGDPDSKSCMASIMADGGAMLLIQVEPGHVDVVVGTGKTLRTGKAGAISVDSDSFDFRPEYSDKRDMMFFADADARVVAALRQARNVAVRVDGRELINLSVENTGVEGALDAVAACSKGESGWWGPGVGAKRATAAPKPEPVLSKEGVWSLAASDDVCSAVAKVEGGAGIVLIAANEGRDIVVGVGVDEGIKRGRGGRLETDAYRFDFKPAYDGKTYMQIDRFLDSEALFQLRRARTLRVSIDGAEVVSMQLDGTGFADVMTSLAACGRGEAGWWGAGAAPPRR